MNQKYIASHGPESSLERTKSPSHAADASVDFNKFMQLGEDGQ